MGTVTSLVFALEKAHLVYKSRQKLNAKGKKGVMNIRTSNNMSELNKSAKISSTSAPVKTVSLIHFVNLMEDAHQNPFTEKCIKNTTKIFNSFNHLLV